jgi:hypothetical protein
MDMILLPYQILRGDHQSVQPFDNLKGGGDPNGKYPTRVSSIDHEST